MSDQAPSLVLASGSAARRRMLERAGVPFTVAPAPVDEAGLKAAFAAEGASVEDCAIGLAEMKARAGARRNPGALVLGADQMLDCDGVWFDKADSLEDARRALETLRGRTHRLISAVVIVRDGERLWHHLTEARLTMRPLSDDALAGYLDAVGEDILGAVGCYHIEGRGVQLFDRIQGDLFTIQGLPLVPLLGFLRVWGVIPQ